MSLELCRSFVNSIVSPRQARDEEVTSFQNNIRGASEAGYQISYAPISRVWGAFIGKCFLGDGAKWSHYNSARSIVNNAVWNVADALASTHTPSSRKTYSSTVERDERGEVVGVSTVQVTPLSFKQQVYDIPKLTTPIAVDLTNDHLELNNDEAITVEAAEKFQCISNIAFAVTLLGSAYFAYRALLNPFSRF